MFITIEKEILSPQTLIDVIQQGIDDVENGVTVPWNEETRSRIRAAGLKKVTLNEPLAQHVTP